LCVNGVKVVGFALPKFQLDFRPRILAVLERLFGLELEDALDLLGPGHD
jgi:hypothetical protein